MYVYIYKSVQGLQLHTHTTHTYTTKKHSTLIQVVCVWLGKRVKSKSPCAWLADIQAEQNSLTSGPERGRQANEHRFNMSTRIHDIKE